MRMLQTKMILVAALAAVCGCGALFRSPGGEPKQPTTISTLVTHRVWENKPTDQVFEAAVRVLHGSDFLIAAAEKSSGLLTTDWKSQQVTKGDGSVTKLRIRLSLLVFQETGVASSAALSYKPLVQIRKQQDGDWDDLPENEELSAQTYKHLAKIRDDFFLEIQRYCGPSVQRL